MQVAKSVLNGLRVPLSDRPFAILLVAWYGVNLIDAGTTWFGLYRGGREAIPLYALLFAHFPFVIGEPVKMVSVTALAGYICTQYHWWRFAAYLEVSMLTAGMAYVVGHNLWTLVTMP